MKTLLAVLTGLLLCWAPVHAAEPTSEMFAFGTRLEVSGQQAFYQLELPLDVYRTVTRRDLGDLRVFNAAGQMVPHILRRPDNTVTREDVVTAELPFFPLRSETDACDGDLSIHVERNPQGTLIDVRANGESQPADDAPVRAYLLDAGELKHPVDTLELVWNERTEDFLGELRIETSSDLSRWRTLTTAAVARLSYGGYRLDRSRIDLPSSAARYLRIARTDHRPLAELVKTIALTHQTHTTRRPQRRWLPIRTLPQAERPNTYLADLEGFLPVDAVRIDLVETNSLAAARLSSGDTAKGPQRQRWQGLVYHLRVDGRSLVSPDISVVPTGDRYWTLSIDGSESALAASPQIEFGWQPARLVFLARGDGPFLLAYGSAKVGPANFPLNQLLQKTAAAVGSEQEPAMIEPSPQQILGGPDRMRILTTWHWKTWLLWTVLLTGVALVGLMSLRLYRQLQDQSHSDKE